MALLDEADQPQLHEVASRQCLVHVAGASIPPRAMTVGATDPGANPVNAKTNQFAGSVVATLPLAPVDGSQFAT